MSVEWRENLATGNVEIDRQHMELFRRFNSLLESCHEGKGKAEVYGLLLFLNNYIRTHFALEEELQVQHDYPGCAAHKEEHDKFRRDLKELERQFAEEGATLSLVIQTNQTMINWLLRHISGTDRKLASFLRTTA